MKKLLLSLLLTVSCSKTEIRTIDAVVIEKVYTSSSYSSGGAVGFSTSGNPVFVSTSSSEPEKFDILLKLSNNEIKVVNNKNLYSILKVNDSVEVLYWKFKYKNGKETGFYVKDVIKK